MRYIMRMKHVFLKNGIYYFERRIPKDLIVDGGPTKVVKSLKTTDPLVAQERAKQFASELDIRWAFERNPSIEMPAPSVRDAALSLLREMGVDPNIGFKWQDEGEQAALENMLYHGDPSAKEAYRILHRGAVYYPHDALELYIQMRCRDRGARGKRDVERPIEYLREFCGEKPIPDYRKRDANVLRDALYAKGMKSSSVKRVFESLRAVFNLAYAEFELSHTSPFSKVVLRKEKVAQRCPFELEALLDIQRQCRELDDPNRWLVALLSDSGLRLGEAVGLVSEDVVLDGPYPHLRVVERPWRRLKTQSSNRLVPLVGESLWAAERALSVTHSDFLFPKYCNEQANKADSASGALSKWLKPRVQQGQVLHSFRHTFRDRLRNVGCPFDIQERLGGWSTPGVGSSYGQGYGLEILHQWMSLLVTYPENTPKA